MTYHAKLDFQAKLTTVLVLVILFSVCYLVLSLPTGDAPIWARLILYAFGVALPIAIALATYLYRPIAYELTDHALVVRRSLSPITVPYVEIDRVDSLSDSFVQDFERMGGNGGVFGYYGEFSAGRDPYQLYVTRMTGTILITTKDGRRIVISPEDHSMAAKLRERILSGSR